jgi:hypothetical protein
MSFICSYYLRLTCSCRLLAFRLLRKLILQIDDLEVISCPICKGGGIIRIVGLMFGAKPKLTGM